MTNSIKQDDLTGLYTRGGLAELNKCSPWGWPGAHSTLMAYINLGKTYYGAMQYDLAWDYFKRCLSLIEAAGFRSCAVWANYYLDILDEEDGNLTLAEKHLKSPIDLAEELGIDSMILATSIDYTGVLIKSGNYRQADADLTWLETHSDIDKCRWF